MNRFIVPCVLDGTPLPQCLQNNVFPRLRRVTAPVVDQLVRALRGTRQLQAGRAPDDPMLAQADLEAAEFLILSAIAQADRMSIDYPAAQHDLALVRRFKRN